MKKNNEKQELRKQGRKKNKAEATNSSSSDIQKQARILAVESGIVSDKISASYTNDFISVKTISHGIIETKDKRYIAITEVMPNNLTDKNEDEILTILTRFHRFIIVSPVRIQIKVRNVKTNIAPIVSDIRDRAEGEPEAFGKLVKAYSDNVFDIGHLSSVERRFYVIYEYKAVNELHKLTKFTDIARELNTTKQTLETYLARMGNKPLPHTRDDKWLISMYYELYNPRSSAAVPAEQRVNRIIDDTAEVLGSDESVDYDQFVSPVSMSGFTQGEYYIIDGMYQSHYIVKSDGYPVKNGAGFLIPLITFDEGFETDIYYIKEPKDQFLKKATLKQRLARASASTVREEHSDYLDVMDIMSAVYYFRTMLRDQNIPLYMGVMFTIRAETLEHLVLKRNYLMNHVNSLGYTVMPLMFNQEAGFRFWSMTLDMPSKLFSRCKQNIVSQDLAGSYPFSAYTLNDEDGIVIGTNLKDRSLIRINPLKGSIYPNSNISIFGTSGSGKTFAMQLLMMRMRMMGIPVYMILPEKPHEWKAGCDMLGGSFIIIAPGSKHHVNIMDIYPKDEEVALVLDGTEVDTVSLLSEQVSEVMAFFSLVIPNMSPRERRFLESAIINAYYEKGITEENNSIYIDPDDNNKSLKEMPIIQDVYNQLLVSLKDLHDKNENMDSALTNIPEIIYHQFIKGNSETFNHHTNVDLNNAYTLFDISRLKDDLPLGAFVTFAIANRKVKESRIQRNMVGIEEGSFLVGSSSTPQVAMMVQSAFKLNRGYGAGVVFATQEIQDVYSLDGGVYSASIVDNSAIKMLFKLTKKEASRVNEELQLDTDKLQLVQDLDRGQCVFVSGGNNIPVAIKASTLEKRLMDTDPEESRRIYESLRNKKAKEARK